MINSSYTSHTVRTLMMLIPCALFSCQNGEETRDKKIKPFNERVEQEKTSQEMNRAAPRFKNGDIIFQSSTSGQSAAIQLATGSKYSHVGIIFEDAGNKGKYFVFEAIQPVSVTPLEAFIKRGDDEHYVVKRFRDSSAASNIRDTEAMKGFIRKYKGKDYDLYFGWSDDLIYCSELVYKVYKEGAGIELGKLQKLEDFDLSSGIVKRIMKERYGNKIPYDETVISPASIFNDPALWTVAEQ